MMSLSSVTSFLAVTFALIQGSLGTGPYANGINSTTPTATTSNGTYVGRYLGGDWQQDLFLGIPYAQPPVGDLRFRWPQSLNETFGTRDASQYGYSCYQYGTTFNLSEDCLNLNGKSQRSTLSKSHSSSHYLTGYK